MLQQDTIIIRGLNQNNLKNVSLDVPKGKIVVFTGISGSGKSSIVFDTIAAESQRQMNETYIIDIGPDGGTAGGEVVFTGSPREMAEHGNTITAEYLRRSL